MAPFWFSFFSAVWRYCASQASAYSLKNTFLCFPRVHFIEILGCQGWLAGIFYNVSYCSGFYFIFKVLSHSCSSQVLRREQFPSGTSLPPRAAMRSFCLPSSLLFSLKCQSLRVRCQFSEAVFHCGSYHWPSVGTESTPDHADLSSAESELFLTSKIIHRSLYFSDGSWLQWCHSEWKLEREPPEPNIVRARIYSVAGT